MGRKGIHGLDLGDVAGEVDPNQDLASLVGEGEPDAAPLLVGHRGPMPNHLGWTAPGGSGQQSVEGPERGPRFRMKGPIGFKP